MNLSKQIAGHFAELHQGDNSTGVNYRDTLSDVTWQQATTQIDGLNTILTLTYHVHYYTRMITGVLKGGPLTGNDKLSFEHPAINSQEEWNELLKNVWADAEEFANLVEKMSDEQFFENFSDGKYGNNYRNIVGLIEHAHYHLGQIVLIKKLISPSHSRHDSTLGEATS
ncbi:MAG: DUF1572 domain-containing protein [Chitinophagales bacterium]|nr:DUF1572 domain-containing protein [Chitinophagales bacterium]